MIRKFLSLLVAVCFLNQNVKLDAVTPDKLELIGTGAIAGALSASVIRATSEKYKDLPEDPATALVKFPLRVGKMLAFDIPKGFFNICSENWNRLKKSYDLYKEKKALFEKGTISKDDYTFWKNEFFWEDLPFAVMIEAPGLMAVGTLGLASYASLAKAALIVAGK